MPRMLLLRILGMLPMLPMPGMLLMVRALRMLGILALPLMLLKHPSSRSLSDSTVSPELAGYAVEGDGLERIALDLAGDFGRIL